MAANDIDDGRGIWSSLVSIELFSELGEALNALIDSVPVGSIVPICTGIPGVPTPDPTIWQEAIGGTIEEQLSHLRNQVTPALGGIYLKGTTNPGTSGVYGGSDTVAIGHNHTGITPEYTVPTDEGDASDGYWTAIKTHTHIVYPDHATIYNIDPIHIRVRLFLKIR